MQQTLMRGLRLLYRPAAEFESARSEAQSTGTLFLRLLLPWLTVESMAIALETSLLNGVKNLFLGIAVTFVAAWSLFVLARLLESTTSFTAAFRIASYTQPLGTAATLLALVLSKLAMLIWLIAGLWGCYITWIGCAITLPKGRAVAIRATAGSTVAALAATVVLALFTGTSPGPGASADDGVSADTIAREHEQFREMLHDAHMRRYR